MKEILAIVGPFVPSNEPMTLIPYKQLRLLDVDRITALTLDYSVDMTIQSNLERDPNYRKFDVQSLGRYNDCLFSIHNVNLVKALFCKQQYIQKVVRWFHDHPVCCIYSSAFPQFNHQAALEIKKQYPSVYWVANFTDPINHSPYKHDPQTYHAYSLIEKIAFKVYCHFYVVDSIEAETFEWADRLIFICTQQRDFMIEQYLHYFNRISKAEVLKKSIIYPLTYIRSWEDTRLLDGNGSRLSNNNKPIVMGHFGRIYGLRLCAKFIIAMRQLIDEHPELANRLIVQQYGEFRYSDAQLIKQLRLEHNFIIQPKLPYNEYMDTLAQCDYVLIFDTILPEDQIQPYLPSKVMEYSLLKKNVLSITTKTSPLYEICQQSHAIVARYDEADIKKALIRLLNNESSVLNYRHSNEECASIMEKAFSMKWERIVSRQ